MYGEKFNITLKKNLIKEPYSSDDYSYSLNNSLKNMVLKYSKYNLYTNSVNKKIKNIINYDDFIDFIELYFTHSAKQKFFKQLIIEKKGFSFLKNNSFKRVNFFYIIF